MRVPVKGGNRRKFPAVDHMDEFRCALGVGKRCVLRTTVPGESRTYYDLESVRGRGQELARTKWSVEFSETGMFLLTAHRWPFPTMIRAMRASGSCRWSPIRGLSME